MNTSKKLKILVLIAATFFALFAFIACNGGGGTSDGNPNSDGGSVSTESMEKSEDSKGGDTATDTASESKGTTESVGGGENVSTPDESTDGKDAETNQPTESGKIESEDGESKGGSENPDESKEDEKKNSLTVVVCDENGETESVYKFASSTTLGEVAKAKFGSDNIENCGYVFYTGELTPENNASKKLEGGRIWAFKKTAIQDSYKITYKISYIENDEYKTVDLELDCNGVVRYDTADKQISSSSEFAEAGILIDGQKKYIGDSEDGELFLGDFGYYYKAVSVKVVPHASINYCIRSFNGTGYGDGTILSFEVEGEEMSGVYPISKIAEKINVNPSDYIWQVGSAVKDNFDTNGIQFGLFDVGQTLYIYEYFTVVKAECNHDDGFSEHSVEYKSGKQITLKEIADKMGVKFDDYDWYICKDGTKTGKSLAADAVIKYDEEVVDNCMYFSALNEDEMPYVLCESKKNKNSSAIF